MRFLMVDRVLDLQPNKRIIAIKNVSVNEESFKGHFDRKAIMPGSLVFESMAQVTGWLIIISREFKCAVVLMFMNGAKIFKDITPGDQLQIECEIINHRLEGTEARVVAKVDGEIVACIDRIVLGHGSLDEQEMLEREKSRFFYLNSYTQKIDNLEA